jgi:hypothetical protein
VNQPMIRMMARGHVYADLGWLDERRLGEKLAVTNAPGARHASFRFVTGELDPMSTREQFLATARRVTDPILVVYGAATPKRSKAEMEALAKVPNVQSHELSVENVHFGSEADIFTFPDQCPLYPQKRTSESVAQCPLCAKSGHRPALFDDCADYGEAAREATQS